MKKQLSIFLAVIFLAVQMGSFAHMAEHGFEQHKHGDNPCQIEAYFSASHSFDSAVSEVVISHELDIQSFKFSSVASSQRVFELSSISLARAPPQIS